MALAMCHYFNQDYRKANISFRVDLDRFFWNSQNLAVRLLYARANYFQGNLELALESVSSKKLWDK